MKVLVTGATGFIGSHIVDQLLERGDAVQALTRSPEITPKMPYAGDISWSAGDLTDQHSLRDATKNVSVVYHAAALLSAPNHTAMQTVNVTGVKNLLDACVQNQVERLVFVSSVSVYAATEAAVIGENAPIGRPWNIYGDTKVQAEALIKSYADTFGLSYNIIRPCVVYGERDYKNFTPRLLRLLSRPIIPVFAGNATHMNLVHAADTARAIILAGTHPNAVNQAYNITGGHPTSLRELAEIYIDLVKEQKFLVPIPMSIFRVTLLVRWLVTNLKHRRFADLSKRFKDRDFQRNAFLQTHQYDIGKARTELGYKPEIELREGLRRTLGWSSHIV